MPEDAWAKDPERREKAGIPGGLEFATKPELAIAQVKAPGSAGAVLLGRRRRGVRPLRGVPGRVPGAVAAYVVIIPCDYRVTIAKDKAPSARTRPRATPCSNGGRAGTGRKAPVTGTGRCIATADPREFLLVRRLDREKNPYTYLPVPRRPGPPGTMTYFVTIAAAAGRWKSLSRTGRTRFGWDQSQART